MISLKAIYHRMRYSNLLGVRYLVWFYEDGREFSREFHVFARSMNGKDRWVVRTDHGNIFSGFKGDYIRHCLTSKELINMDGTT